MTTTAKFFISIRKTGRRPRLSKVRALGARRVRLPSRPWLALFTSRCWLGFRGTSRGGVGFRLTDAVTGLSLGESHNTREAAVNYGEYVLAKRTRRAVLARIAATAAGYFGKKIPKRFKYRSL